jgi:hypothetical protein
VSPSNDLVTLRLGATVPREVLDLGFALEARGITLDLTDDGRIHAAPAALLTDPDRAALRQWREHVVLLLMEFDRYAARPAGWRLS